MRRSLTACALVTRAVTVGRCRCTAAEIARSSIGTPFARYSVTVPMKPNIARELAALAPFENADDATIFRRTASEVMVSFARAMMAEHRSMPSAS